MPYLVIVTVDKCTITRSLGYDWEAKWLDQVGISYLTITGYMEDVFRISSIKQERGLSYPFSRKFSVSLSVRF